MDDMKTISSKSRPILLGIRAVDCCCLALRSTTSVLENFALRCTYEDSQDSFCGHKDKSRCLAYASFSSPKPRAVAYDQPSLVISLHEWELMNLSVTEGPLALRDAEERVILQDASS